MTLITLLTDFGLKDGYPGVMKGVIWGIAPQAQIADITHLIQPQNVLEGALVLSRAAPYFPPGTIHLAVVDPGVGTSRRPIAAMLGNQFFVGPDNGLCSQLLAHSQLVGASTHFVHLNRPEFWLSQPSSTFHGRDIFAPAAAHLTNGVDLSELGTPIGDPVVISPPQPVRSKRGWRGEVILVDSFGNLSTNLTRQHLKDFSNPLVKISGRQIQGLAQSFGSGQPGNLLAFIGEAGDLSIGVVNGSAAQTLAVSIGEPLEIWTV